MDGLALGLPPADDREFFIDNIVRRKRMARDEQDEDIAGAEFPLYLALQSAPPEISRSTQSSDQRRA